MKLKKKKKNYTSAVIIRMEEEEKNSELHPEHASASQPQRYLLGWLKYYFLWLAEFRRHSLILRLGYIFAVQIFSEKLARMNAISGMASMIFFFWERKQSCVFISSFFFNVVLNALQKALKTIGKKRQHSMH